MNPNLFRERLVSWSRQISIRRGTDDPNDGVKFVELFNSIYARQITPAYYSWRFCDESSKGTVLFAHEQEHLAGVCGYHLCTMSGSSSFQTGLVVDMMVETRHRGTGLIFARLNLEVEDSVRRSGAKAVFLFPNSRGASAWLADRTWKQLAQMTTYVCDTRSASLDPSLDIQLVSRFGVWVDGLVNAFQRNHPGLSFVRRGADYLNWRFVANPVYHYDLFQVHYRNELFGYLALKVFRDQKTGQRVGDIVDLLWAEDAPDALAEMLRFALRYFYVQDVPQAATWLQTNTILDDVGRDLGFAETGQKRSFCCKAHDEQFKSLEDPRRWFITMVDSEIY